MKNTYDLSNWEHFLPRNLRGGLRPSLNLTGGGECPPGPPPVSAPGTRKIHPANVLRLPVISLSKPGFISVPISVFYMILNLFLSVSIPVSIPVSIYDSTIGCQIQGVYMGIWVYADDIILLSSIRTVLREMVKRN